MRMKHITIRPAHTRVLQSLVLFYVSSVMVVKSSL